METRAHDRSLQPINPSTHDVNREGYVAYLAMRLALLLPGEHTRCQRANVSQSA